jgi:glucose-6-phosphate dehydrogenase assembly protein OpcA
VSALAEPGADGAGVRERSEWRGEDVTAAEVAERLLALNREHARHEHGHAATRTLNLLVAPADDVPADALKAQLAGLSDRHPSRTIVVREGAPRRLDAFVAIDCTIGSGSGCAGHCHDMALLVADAERLAHADSLVRPLRVAGLPTVLWLPGTRASSAQEPLAALARAIVLDSGAASGAALAAAFARAAGLDVARVRDVAWLRLARWRRHVAARFDDTEAVALLERIERVELRSCAAQQASALLLAAWIAARAGWALERLAPQRDGWTGVARRADGAAVELTIGPPAEQRRVGIHALALHAAGATIALRAPVAAPNPARAFAAALGMFDTATPGYAPALGALLDGMRAGGVGIAPIAPTAPAAGAP